MPGIAAVQGFQRETQTALAKVVPETLPQDGP